MRTLRLAILAVTMLGFGVYAVQAGPDGPSGERAGKKKKKQEDKKQDSGGLIDPFADGGKLPGTPPSGGGGKFIDPFAPGNGGGKSGGGSGSGKSGGGSSGGSGKFIDPFATGSGK